MLAATALAVGSAGCDDDAETGTEVASAGGSGTAAGMLSWGMAERPRRLDPLFAESPGEQLVTRQIHEPLAGDVAAPFDSPRREPGLALSVLPSSDSSLWRLRLRQGVRFGDGTPFTAQAVLANAERWQSSAAGRSLLGDFLADAPRPDLVRFILDGPDPAFGDRLEDPRLGMVSPRALARSGGSELSPAELAGSGTGAFELRERAVDRLTLARETEWWGAERGFGPGVDQLEFVVVPESGERLDALTSGSLQVAADLRGPQLRDLRRDPLLTTVGSGAGVLGVERSVRGLPDDGPVPVLNAVWRTGIDGG